MLSEKHRDGKDPGCAAGIRIRAEPGRKKTKSRKREWIREEEKPKGQSVATWTEDETQAMYFGSVIEAQRVIDRWPVLKMAKATIISA